MAHEVIQHLVRLHVGYVVAPYEADAQMAFLIQSGKVHAIVSEDSDMLAFGCHRVLFKLETDGWGKEIELSRLGENTEVR